MSPGPLALIGGKEWDDGCTFDADLLRSVDADDVVVVAAAAAYERPERTIEKARVWFDGLGVSVIDSGVLNRRDAESETLERRVREASFVYLADGSAMHLRSVLKGSRVLRAMTDMWLDGGVIAGSSAGAVVLTDPMIDPRGGAFTLGFGLVRQLTAVPHWEKWTGEKSRRVTSLAPKGSVIAEIEERTALVRWKDGTWTVSGAGSVNLVRDRSPLDLDELSSAVLVG